MVTGGSGGSAGTEGGDGDASGPGDGDRDGDGDGDGSGDGDGDGDGDGSGDGDGDSGGGVRFDVGEGGEESGGDGGSEGGCNKVDFLFVVDNSSSMFSHQEALTASFPAFIQSITDRVESNDFHIMVVDTDTKADPSDGCGECYDRCVASPATSKNCGFNDPNDSGAPNVCNGMQCADISPEAPDACDYVLGAGVIDDRWEQPCGIQGDQRYITGGQADLADTFACIAKTGVYGTGKELPMGAMVDALAMNGAGQCNEGFVRDDAILVVTILSDALYAGEAYQPPQAWYDALVTAKKGNAEAIVMLGLFRSDPAVVPGPACQLGAGTCGSGGFTNCDTTYEDLVYLFDDRGIANSICIDDFGPFFTSALDTIELTCDDFTPVG